MPIYEYQGQQYDISDTDPGVAKQKILSYLGNQTQQTTVGEDLEIGLKNTAKQILSGTNLVVGGAADIAGNLGVPGAQAMSGRMQRGLDVSRSEIDQSMADITGKEQGLGGKLISAVPSVGAALAGGAPTMLASAIGSGAETQQTLKGMGVDEDTAALAGTVTGGLNLVGMKVNPMVGSGAVKAMATGGGINVGQSLLQNFINKNLLETAGYDQQAQMFANKAEDLTADALIGAAFGKYGQHQFKKGVTQAKAAKDASDVILNRLQESRAAANEIPPSGDMAVRGAENLQDTASIDAQLARARNPYFKPATAALDDLGIPYNKFGSEQINKLTTDEGFQKLVKKAEAYDEWAADWLAQGKELTPKDLAQQDKLREQFVAKLDEFGITGKEIDTTWGKDTAKQHVLASEETMFPTEINSKASNEPVEPVKTGVGILDTAANKKASVEVSGLPVDYVAAPVSQGEGVKSILGTKLASFTDAPVDPAQVKAAIAKEPDIDTGRAGKVWNQVIAGAQFKAAETKNTLIKAVKSAYDMSVNRGNQLAEDNVRPMEQTIAKLSPEERALGIDLILSTEGKKAYTRAELEAAKTPESVIQLMETWYDASAKALKAVNDAREAKGLDPIESRPGYFPSRWSGQYGLEVRDSDGVLITMLRGHSSKEMEKARTFLAKSNPEYKFGDITRQNLRDPNFKQADKFYGLHELLDTIGQNDPQVDKVLQAYNEYLNKAGTNLFGLRKHELDKAGIMGFEGAKAYKTRQENAVEGWTSALEYLDQSFKYAEINKGMVKANDLMSSPEAAHMTNAKEYLQDYLDTNMGKQTGLTPQVNAIVDSMMQMVGKDMKSVQTYQKIMQDWLHITKMGLSAPFLFTQAVQPFAVFPEFAMHMRQAGVSDINIIKGMATAWKFLGSGAKTLAESSYVPNGRLEVSKFSADAQPYVKGAVERGVIGSSLMYDIKTLGESKTVATVKHGAAGTQNMTENSSRLYTFFMYAKALETSGMPKDQAMDTAANITKMAMVDYSQHEKSLALNKAGVLGQSFGNLKSFILNSLSRGSFHLNHFKDTGDFKPFAAYLMMQMAVGGVTGVIAFTEADEIVKLISKALGKPTSLSGLVHRNLPEWAEFGVLSSMTGLDFSTRFQTKLLPMSEDGIDWRSAFPTVSLPVGQAMDVGSFIKDPTTVGGMRAARSLAPATFTGAIEERPTFKEGDMALSPTKGTGIIERTPEEQMFNKLVGMKSIREASMKKEAFEGAGLVKKNEEAKKGLVEKAVKIVDSGGTGGFAMQALFNEYAKLNAGDTAPLENAILYHMQSKQMDVGQNVQGIPSTSGKSLSRFMITEGAKR